VFRSFIIDLFDDWELYDWRNYKLGEEAFRV